MQIGSIFVGRVISENGRRAIVEIEDFEALLPAENTPVDLHRLVGKLFHFKIVETPSDSRPVAEHFRPPVYSIYESPRQPIEIYDVGQQHIGIVRNIAEFGAFIDLGMMDGLLRFEGTRLTEDDFKVDQVLTVTIACVEMEKEKLLLKL
ncbi:MAG: hypothetical protein AAF394_01030 [Planctomycetota bacterium]